jgi:arylsulfatase
MNQPSVKIFLWSLASVLLWAGCNQSESSDPNIIILFCDDMGYGDMGITGHPIIRTPHLDRLAMDGARMTNFYSASPACTASRYALLTGRYPVRSGFGWVLNPDSPRGIHRDEQTIAELLKQKGYATACYGKWHLGTTQKDFLPLQNGFDEYFGLPYSNDMIPPRFPDIPLLEGNDTLELNPDQSPLTKRYTDRALDFIERNQDQPFFLYLPYAMPHVPLYPGEDFKGNSARGLYGDVIEEIDWSVGQIRAKLEYLGLAENTLLVFTSDNGPWIIKDERGGSAGLFRDGKGSTWEGGMRVPGIFYWKDKIPAGSFIQQPASTIDLLPTIAMLTDTKTEAESLDGANIWPLLQGEAFEEERPYFYYGLNNRLFAVRQGSWKLHIATYSQTGKTYFEKEVPLLFNLAVDPSEQYEISAQYPEKVAELQQLIETHLTSLATTPGYYGPLKIQ